MDYEGSSGDPMPVFYVGQHETRRSCHVTEQTLQQAHDCNYDMLSTPISTSEFHSSVLTLLSDYMSKIEDGVDANSLPLPLIAPFRPIDTPLTPTETVSQLLAFTSSWVDLASPDPLVAHLSRQVLNQEIAYAAFCGIVNVYIEGPKLYEGADIAQYARAILEASSLGPYVHIHILLSMSWDPDTEPEQEIGDLNAFARPEYFGNIEAFEPQECDLFGTWDAWNAIRSVCKYSSRLSVALSLPRRLPPLAVQSRWYSEPLKLLLLPGGSFLKNVRGSYVLSKSHQGFIARCMRLRNAPWILLSDVGTIPGLDDSNVELPLATALLQPDQLSDANSSMSPSPTPAESSQVQISASRHSKDDPTPHLSYMRYLQRNQPVKSMIERFGAGYQDYLQSPLQPLTDNLESITYEVFEKDPIKYAWYQRAIEQALSDWKIQEKPTSSPSGAVVVAVVGAGRGPLVTRAIQASQSTGVEIELHAVEKNPNAFVVLQRHNTSDWEGKVTLVKSDMRAWKGPKREDGTYGHVDIIVSELLGSFADNELSPECLDGVQHVMASTHGISIPQSYTAHFTPISAPNLYADILSRSDLSAYETSYVVMLHAIDYLSVDIEEPPAKATSEKSDHKGPPKIEIWNAVPKVKLAWEFMHPIPKAVLDQSNTRRGGGASGGIGGQTGGDGANEHNVRSVRATFDCKYRGVCHGIGGYFETVLYEGTNGKVELSTNPVTMASKSEDMISWFPIFWPLKEPLYIPEDSQLDISMWRQTDDRKVWYEWLVESYIRLGDKRIRLGTSALHSSKRNGCL
ncbi:Skb1 methyltransferase, partial [Pseudovirgaria hyperparasitica]